jgi:hypothetical protein
VSGCGAQAGLLYARLGSETRNQAGVDAALSRRLPWCLCFELQQALERKSDFPPIVASGADAQIHLEVALELRRWNFETRLKPSACIRLQLRKADGAVLWEGLEIAFKPSEIEGYTHDEFVADPSLLERGFRQRFQQVALALADRLSAK